MGMVIVTEMFSVLWHLFANVRLNWVIGFLGVMKWVFDGLRALTTGSIAWSVDLCYNPLEWALQRKCQNQLSLTIVVTMVTIEYFTQSILTWLVTQGREKFEKLQYSMQCTHLQQIQHFSRLLQFKYSGWFVVLVVGWGQWEWEVRDYIMNMYNAKV